MFFPTGNCVTPRSSGGKLLAVSTERHVQQCCSTVRKLPRPIPATRALTAAHTPPLCPRSAVRKNHPLVPQHFSQHYFSTPPPPPPPPIVSVCAKSLQHIDFSMYIGPPNGTAFAQGCDETELNQRFGQHVENFFLEWLACPRG